MASVKVAVRTRPFNQREHDMGAKLIIQMDGKKTRITNSKSPEQFKDFTFDHSYWSFDQQDPHFASQEQVFGDLGKDVVDAAFEGYNACVFAYGQTGSGKTFTMTGTPDNQGLIPRICESLFGRMASGASYRTEVSYLEIYNERVKDLLQENATGHNLRVREHPRSGPYVSDLSRHLVSEYAHIQELMARGNSVRTTASTNMNDTSSRSHAIFTLQFVQAGFSNDVPSETLSKVHLVDLAGSERADATGATGQRLKEGAHINKSLVTLGSVISALAELSTPDCSRKSAFIPYRNSVLTWLLKDSLGGNSKTIMIAAISPADCNYSETLSTLRYANRAKNIINKPTINEDPNVKLIKELRDEITKLRGLLCSELTVETPQMLATLQKKEAQEKVLTERWAEKWRETQKILQEQKALGLRKAGTGVVLDSDMPHLIGIDDNLLSTGVTLYHLKDGETVIGSDEAEVKPDIVLNGVDVETQHCSIVLTEGVATLVPHLQAQCWVNGCLVDRPTRLSQGCQILLCRNNMFQYNDPVEAKKLRKEGWHSSSLNLSRLSLISWSTNLSDRTCCQILLGRNNMFRYNDPVEAEKLRKEGCHSSSLNLSRLSLISWSTNDLTQSSENLQTSFENLENKGKLEIQRAELLKEKEAFKLEQAEKEQGWEKEQQLKREALEQAQKQLEHERQQMEEAYVAQCKRLAEDWQRLEQHQAHSLATLRCREAELDKNRQLLQCERDEEIAAISVERKALAEVQKCIELKKKELKEFVTRKMREMFTTNNNIIVPEDKIKPLCVLAAEKFCEGLCWLDLTVPSDQRLSPPPLATDSPDSWVSFTSALKEGIVGEIVSHHKEAISKLEAELHSRAQSVVKREKKINELNFQLKEIPQHDYDPDSDVPNSDKPVLQPTGENKSELLPQKEMLNLELAPVTMDLHSSPETFHTAPSPSPPAMSDSGVGLNQRWDDSDDLSSNDGSCRNQGYRLRHFCNKVDHNELNTEDDNVSKTMKLLMQKITRQRLHIIRSLESDLDTIDTNQEITVLQDLKREYVRLEKKFEGRGKENIRSSEESDDASTSAEETNRMQAPLSPIMNLSVSNQFMDHLPPYNYSMARSMPSLNPSYGWEESDPGLVVKVPTYVLRGAGSSTHYAYEVRLSVGGECWAVLRRYSRFRELYLHMKQKYGSKVAALTFPPRRLFARQAEWLAQERRPQLERYLQSLLQVVAEIPGSPLHRDTSKSALLLLSPFFRRGVFESSKYGTS